MKNLFYFLPLLLSFACTTSETSEEKQEIENNTSNHFKVEYAGALKNMMHENDIEAKIDLADFENQEHFYALGAMENLKGEIQIFDGESYNTQVIDSSLSIDKSLDKKATLLVYATVNSWTSIDVAEDVVSYEDLEVFVAEMAEENGIDITEPFPFLLEGMADSVLWHVINWKDGDTEHSHDKHISSGLNGTLENVEVDMLGFYSDAHHAIFTHHTTNMHIHFKTKSSDIAGHADGVVLGKGMVLKLPAVNQ